MTFGLYPGVGILACFPFSFSTVLIANNASALEDINCSIPRYPPMDGEIRVFLAEQVIALLKMATNYTCKLEKLAFVWLLDIYHRGTTYDGLKAYFDEANASVLEVSQATFSFTKRGTELPKKLKLKPHLDAVGSENLFTSVLRC
ncbi:unnamed protein product [Cylicocyclus nassatus]|uniref:Uncharacterized protein n=1 Tax=Cylicocyclus nassatus TaxID=53992 RepID=A0AA36DR97_CYLNA|nr:unnamed protein product [Cylicocyclus nassatus]